VNGDIAHRVQAPLDRRWGERRAIEMIGSAHGLSRPPREDRKVASFNEPVSHHGRSGSGKEAIAQALSSSARGGGHPYISWNCPQ